MTRCTTSGKRSQYYEDLAKRRGFGLSVGALGGACSRAEQVDSRLCTREWLFISVASSNGFRPRYKRYTPKGCCTYLYLFRLGYKWVHVPICTHFI
jgi:hypothetical protein